jgi:hypothetical protein
VGSSLFDEIPIRPTRKHVDGKKKKNTVNAEKQYCANIGCVSSHSVATVGWQCLRLTELCRNHPAFINVMEQLQTVTTGLTVIDECGHPLTRRSVLDAVCHRLTTHVRLPTSD